MIQQLDRPLGLGAMPALVELLIDVVNGGASVGFLAPLSYNAAQAYWRETLIQVRNAERLLFISTDEQRRLAGTVQVKLAGPPNGRHRAAIEKLLVAGRYRRKGHGAALLAAAEAAAAAAKRSLLVLDTRSGDPAELLYAKRGWQAAGVIPGYALESDGTPADATFWFKRLCS